MPQNLSSAVMQQRNEPNDSLDDFPTPPWATRALCEYLKGAQTMNEPSLNVMTCREPTANRGSMVHALEEYFETVEASDVHDYGAGFEVRDYLFGPDPTVVDWTITNPPFRAALEFIFLMLRTSRVGCAVLVRSAFLETVSRYNELFSIRPPNVVLQFSERVVMHKGKLVEKGSTATAYCWLIWRNGDTQSKIDWVPPCRKLLEKSSDYEAAHR